MRDAQGREINYLRISITDRCNLRCRYCMPHGVPTAAHGDILTYEELVTVASCAVGLGITRFKITGGEPLVRRDCAALVGMLKALPGVEQVTLTTNGLLLADQMQALYDAGLDGVNVSIDALERQRYSAITGCAGEPPCWERLLEACLDRGWNTKVNVVLQEANREEWLSLASLAEGLPVDVRFIELMPLGWGSRWSGAEAREALKCLRDRWPDLHPVTEVRGNGPARYYAARGLQGRLGVIDAVSGGFCAGCNRVRLTSTGWLKPCLCFEEGVDLRSLLRSGAEAQALCAAMEQAIAAKPAEHCFDRRDAMTERRTMSQIGG